MSTQIAVRLPDEIVDYIDEQVRSGRARSRAAVLSRAIARDARRDRAERDLVILLAERGSGHSDDLNNLAEVAALTPLDLD
jgi:Arc/MetJ-type ribon-helix-helix transcriptional regulator